MLMLYFMDAYVSELVMIKSTWIYLSFEIQTQKQN